MNLLMVTNNVIYNIDHVKYVWRTAGGGTVVSLGLGKDDIYPPGDDADSIWRAFFKKAELLNE